MQIGTCRAPVRSIGAPADASFLRSISRPMTNSRRISPISATVWMLAWSVTHLRPIGPMTTPVSEVGEDQRLAQAPADQREQRRRRDADARCWTGGLSVGVTLDLSARPFSDVDVIPALLQRRPLVRGRRGSGSAGGASPSMSAGDQRLEQSAIPSSGGQRRRRSSGRCRATACSGRCAGSSSQDRKAKRRRPVPLQLLRQAFGEGGQRGVPGVVRDRHRVARMQRRRNDTTLTMWPEPRSVMWRQEVGRRAHRAEQVGLEHPGPVVAWRSCRACPAGARLRR